MGVGDIRIVGGVWGGRRLTTPRGVGTRPTTNPNRETIFNIVVQGMKHELGRVLDLFAGTGALSFEALSRGAERAVLVESDKEAIRCIKKNSEDLVVVGDTLQVITESRIHKWADEFENIHQSFLPFNTIFCDPPYGQQLVSRSLNFLEGTELTSSLSRVFAPGAILVVEQGAKESKPALSPLWVLQKERSRGLSTFLFYRRQI